MDNDSFPWGKSLIVTPITLNPCWCNRTAATEESTPPLMATTTDFSATYVEGGHVVVDNEQSIEVS